MTRPVRVSFTGLVREKPDAAGASPHLEGMQTLIDILDDPNQNE